MMVSLPVRMDVCSCLKCGRKISVSRAINGTNHTVEMDVVCWDCLSKDKKKIIENFGLDEDDLK